MELELSSLLRFVGGWVSLWSAMLIDVVILLYPNVPQDVFYVCEGIVGVVVHVA